LKGHRAAIAAASVPVLVGSLCALALLLNKGVGPVDTRHPVLLWALAGASALVAASAALRVARAAREAPRALAAGALACALAIAGAELAVRALAEPAPTGERVGDVDLLPYDWHRVAAQNRTLLETRRSPASLTGPDPEIGWDIGESRSTDAGMHRTSEEGIRSAEAGERLADRAAPVRVALIGDSFTFAEEVPFEQTWGEQLARLLAGGAQVLNFGVSSHGMDQTLLKYRREVRGWQPRVTVLSFLQRNVFRNGFVYLPLHPGLEQPFSKPRFALRDGALERFNDPLAPAESVLAAGSVFELPLLEHEADFDPGAWRPHWFHASYLVRFALSAFPRWPAPPEALSKSALIELTEHLIRTLRSEIEAAGSRSVLVFLPTASEIAGGSTAHKDRLLRALSAHGVEVFDATPCLLEGVAPAEIFVASRAHYSPAANARLAACLAPLVQAKLRP
jgi:hypothetical protein